MNLCYINNLDSKKAIAFLQTICTNVAKNDKEAELLCKLEIASWTLIAGDTKDSIKQIREIKKRIDNINSIDSRIHAAYYRAYSAYLMVSVISHLVPLLPII